MASSIEASDFNSICSSHLFHTFFNDDNDHYDDDNNKWYANFCLLLSNNNKKQNNDLYKNFDSGTRLQKFDDERNLNCFSSMK